MMLRLPSLKQQTSDDAMDAGNRDGEKLNRLYQDRSFLGSGGLGVVVQGRHFMDQAWYAMKCIPFDWEYQERLINPYVQTIAKLAPHENIVPYKGCWFEKSSQQDDDMKTRLRQTIAGRRHLPVSMVCLRMPLYEGNLQTFINERNSTLLSDGLLQDNGDRSLPVTMQRLNRKVINDVVSGLAFLHSNKIVHRNIKPSNILFHLNPMSFKISDFGIAVMFFSQSQKKAAARLYAAPEQVAKQDYGLPADVYALALILFQIVYPFTDPDDEYDHLVKLKQQQCFPEAFKEQQPELCAVITRMLSDEPDQRPIMQEVTDVKLAEVPFKRLATPAAAPVKQDCHEPQFRFAMLDNVTI